MFPGENAPGPPILTCPPSPLPSHFAPTPLTIHNMYIAVKDSLTHHPISQGWASWYPLIDFWPVFTSVGYMFHLCELFCPILWLVKSMSCLSGLCTVCPVWSGLCTVCLVCLVCVLCVLFVWSVCYMSCLSGLPFFPSYFLHS